MKNDLWLWMVMGTAFVVGALALATRWWKRQRGIWIDGDSFRKRETRPAGLFISVQRAISAYLQAVAKTIVEGLVLLCVTVVLTVVIYGLVKLAWFSYQASPIGQAFADYFARRAYLINVMMGKDLLLFPVTLTLVSLGVGLVFSACCRLLHITRYGYLPRGLVGQVVLFALPMNLGAAAIVRPLLPAAHWGAAYTATLIPTLLVFANCFRFTSRLLPELGMVWSVGKHNHKVSQQVLFLQDLNSNKKIVEFDPLAQVLTGKHYRVDDLVDARGLCLRKNGHQFFLYRYGHDVFFQVDDHELTLQPDMLAHWTKEGRFERCFALSKQGAQLFRLAWSALPLFGRREPAAAFFSTFDSILQSRTALENAFVADMQTDPSLSL